MAALDDNATLILRVNAIIEVLATSEVIGLLHEKFGSSLLTCVMKGAESEGPLVKDKRFAKVVVLDTAAGRFSTLKAIKAASRKAGVSRTVLAVSREYRLPYYKHLLTLYTCPGKRYIADPRNGIYGAFSIKGIQFAFDVLARLIGKAVSKMRRAVSTMPNSSAAIAKARRAGNIKSILWIRVDGLGDAAMGLPSLRMLRENFPNATITALVRPISAPLMRRVTDVDEVIAFEPPEAPGTTRSKIASDSHFALAKDLRRLHTDLAVDIAGIDSARRVAFASGARYRLGPERSFLDPDGANLSWMMNCPVAADVSRRSSVEMMMETLDLAGMTRPKTRYNLEISEAEKELMRGVLCGMGISGDFAIVHSRSADRDKEWQPSRFAAVARHLIQKHNLQIMITGTQRDRESAEEIATICGCPESVVIACGKLEVDDLPAVYSLATLMVSVDTGPVHVASMVGTPIITVMLPWLVHYSPYLQADHVVTPTVDDLFESLPADGSRPKPGELLNRVAASDVIRMVEHVLQDDEAPRYTDNDHAVTADVRRTTAQTTGRKDET
jgi:ADP-heptose:LPS heptosyltransferase